MNENSQPRSEPEQEPEEATVEGGTDPGEKELVPFIPGPWQQVLTPEEIHQLPLQQYEGPIHFVRTREESLRAVEVLRLEPALGFDTESRPAFRKGESYPPSLAQIGSRDGVWLFQLHDPEVLPPLTEILASPDIVKVGVAPRDDLKGLARMEPFKAASVVDLSHIATQQRIPGVGLRALAARFMHIRISKAAQRTNWGRRDLSPQQIRYAATDAWVCLELYRLMDIEGLLTEGALQSGIPRPPQERKPRGPRPTEE